MTKHIQNVLFEKKYILGKLSRLSLVFRFSIPFCGFFRMTPCKNLAIAPKVICQIKLIDIELILEQTFHTSHTSLL